MNIEKKRKNQPTSFSEGWVEFKSRKVARQVAEELNNQQVGGKRRNPWYHEFWNIKYLMNFRWTHLRERQAYEQEVRKQRLRQEVDLAKKEANFYVQNFEKSIYIDCLLFRKLIVTLFLTFVLTHFYKARGVKG